MSEGAEWITASPSYASKGIREVVIDVAPNEELSPRSGRLDFNSSLGSVSVRIIQEKGEEPVEEPDIIIPDEPEAPVADLLDVVFNADGTAYDCSGSEMNVEFVEGFSSVNYYNEIYKRYVSHYSHKISTSVNSGYYRIDYTDDPVFKAALADGHTLEVVFRMDVRPNGEEIKPFSSMGAGGTGFLVTAASRGTDITFLPNVSTEGKSSYKWTGGDQNEVKGVFIIDSNGNSETLKELSHFHGNTYLYLEAKEWYSILDAENTSTTKPPWTSKEYTHADNGELKLKIKVDVRMLPCTNPPFWAYIDRELEIELTDLR